MFIDINDRMIVVVVVVMTQEKEKEKEATTFLPEIESLDSEKKRLQTLICKEMPHSCKGSLLCVSRSSFEVK